MHMRGRNSDAGRSYCAKVYRATIVDGAVECEGARRGKSIVKLTKS
jgi:hypothetical protein